MEIEEEVEVMSEVRLQVRGQRLGCEKVASCAVCSWFCFRRFSVWLAGWLAGWPLWQIVQAINSHSATRSCLDTPPVLWTSHVSSSQSPKWQIWLLGCWTPGHLDTWRQCITLGKEESTHSDGAVGPQLEGHIPQRPHKQWQLTPKIPAD